MTGSLEILERSILAILTQKLLQIFAGAAAAAAAPTPAAALTPASAALPALTPAATPTTSYPHISVLKYVLCGFIVY
jgi:hypothetical protein